MEGKSMEVIIISLFTLILYFRTIWFSIIIDDIGVYVGRQGYTRSWDKSRGEGAVKKNFKSMIQEFFRELGSRTYGGGTFTTDPWLDHLLSIFTTAVIGCLIFMVFGYSKVSFCAALLYVANPANHQISIWLNGRRYAITVIMVLLMLLWKPFGIVLYPMTFFWNHALAFFAPILFLDIGYWLLILIPIVYFFKGKELRDKVRSRMDKVLSSFQKSFTKDRPIIIVKSYGFFFFKMITPLRVLINNPELYWWGINEKDNKNCYAINLEFFKGLLAVVISIGLLIYFQDYMKIMWLFTVLSILQWSAITSAVQINAERYMAVPIVFMMFFLSYFINMLPYANYVYVAIITYYATNLQGTMFMYKSIDHYQKYQMLYAPDIAKPRFNRIDFYFQQGRFLTAWYLIEEGLGRMPNDFLLLYQAAVCLNQIGNLDQAMHFINLAKQNMYLGQEEAQTKHLDRMITTIQNRMVDKKNFQKKMEKQKKAKK